MYENYIEEFIYDVEYFLEKVKFMIEDIKQCKIRFREIVLRLDFLMVE